LGISSCRETKTFAAPRSAGLKRNNSQQQQQGAMAGMQGGSQAGENAGQQSSQQQGGGDQQAQGSAGNAPAGEQDPNAKAGGMQVAQLETDPNAGDQGGAETGPKPQPVAIGDKAMQIKSVTNAPGIVGTQQPSTAQQMEKQVGGGKGSTAVPAGRNAAERGRAIPAGL
jgi:hypothetical protein